MRLQLVCVVNKRVTLTLRNDFNATEFAVTYMRYIKELCSFFKRKAIG